MEKPITITIDRDLLQIMLDLTYDFAEKELTESLTVPNYDEIGLDGWQQKNQELRQVQEGCSGIKREIGIFATHDLVYNRRT